MKKILIIILVLIIVSVGGWLLASQTGLVNNYSFSFQPNFDISKCENISISRIQQECYLYEAIKSNNPELCKFLNSGRYEWNSEGPILDFGDCLKTIAANTWDTSVCEKTEDKIYKIPCEAITSKNPSKCKEITENVIRNPHVLQNVCNVEVAVFTENSASCENAVDLGYSFETDYEKESCYKRFSTRTDDLGLCTGKSNFCNLFKLLCVSKSFLWGDRLCPFVKTVSATDTLDATKCDNSDCYLLLAYQTNNAELCKGEYKCYNDIAVRTKNPNICSKIEKEYERDSCIKNIAVITKNSAICNNVNTTWMKSSCVAELSK